MRLTNVTTDPRQWRPRHASQEHAGTTRRCAERSRLATNTGTESVRNGRPVAQGDREGRHHYSACDHESHDEEAIRLWFLVFIIMVLTSSHPTVPGFFGNSKPSRPYFACLPLNSSATAKTSCCKSSSWQRASRYSGAGCGAERGEDDGCRDFHA